MTFCQMEIYACQRLRLRPALVRSKSNVLQHLFTCRSVRQPSIATLRTQNRHVIMIDNRNLSKQTKYINERTNPTVHL